MCSWMWPLPAVSLCMLLVRTQSLNPLLPFYVCFALTCVSLRTPFALLCAVLVWVLYLVPVAAGAGFMLWVSVQVTSQAFVTDGSNFS